MQKKRLLAQNSASLETLDNIVSILEEKLPKDAIVALKGDLASGKTTLVQAIAKKRGSSANVSSPTFSLQHYYGDGLYHYDLYRSSFEELARLGLLEEFDKSGWHLVEWLDEKLQNFLLVAGYPIYIVTISVDKDYRNYKIEFIDA